MISKNRKAAIEMSMTTIVTIVLVVVTLVLALVLIRSIFTSSTNAIGNVDNAIQDQINKLFDSEGTNLVIYPASRDITITRGDTPKGFGFSILNPEKTTATFQYTITAGDVHNCGTSFTQEQADQYILGNQGNITLGPGAKLSPYILVRFDVPKAAVPCTIIYNLNVVELTPNDNAFPTNVFVTIK